MNRFMPAREGFLGLDDADGQRADPSRAGAVLVLVPFERTSSYGGGSAAGPAAIVAASHQVEQFDTELGYEPWAAAGGIATLSPLDVDASTDGAAVAARLEPVAVEWIEAGKRVITLAGEHTGVVGSIRAHARHVRDLTVVQLDAHSDMRATYQSDPWNHACTMNRVLDFHRNIVQVGIRSEAPEERAVVAEHRIPVFGSAIIHARDQQGTDWIAPIVEACAKHVYVSLDLDAFDPSVIPATGTPEPGGLSWRQVDALLARLCRERQVVGFDVSELAPIPGIHHPQFAAAKLVYRLIGRMFGGNQPVS